ncbi:MAG TPA: hypothetical protein VEA61_07410 [Allosphingosinicella sp.]|nr:hypothetical protein [Allosphingosinicella sp.]
MSEPKSNQLNVRSNFARKRATDIARGTGMTVTQVVEEALRAYHPAGLERASDGLIRKGRILVKPAAGGKVSAAEADSLIDAFRTRPR